MSAGDFAEVYSTPEYAAAFDAVRGAGGVHGQPRRATQGSIHHWQKLTQALPPALGPRLPPRQVACCFFLDTAHNVLQYLETTWHVLKVRRWCSRGREAGRRGLPPFSSTVHHARPPPFQPSGYFVNLGPLLYHWADAHTYLPGQELSVELSLEEVKAAAARVGGLLLTCGAGVAGGKLEVATTPSGGPLLRQCATQLQPFPLRLRLGSAFCATSWWWRLSWPASGAMQGNMERCRGGSHQQPFAHGLLYLQTMPSPLMPGMPSPGGSRPRLQLDDAGLDIPLRILDHAEARAGREWRVRR